MSVYSYCSTVHKMYEYRYLLEEALTLKKHVGQEVDQEVGCERADYVARDTAHAGRDHVHARPEPIVQYVARQSCEHTSIENLLRHTQRTP